MGEERRRAVLDALCGEATALAGEMMLGHLCETARNLLTDMNSPEGDCVFCLEPLSDPGGPSEQLQRLPCYHCFHL